MQEAPAETAQAQGPWVSVVTPCYKQAHFLGDCVRSVLEQRGEGVDIEVIVVDDGSPDDVAAAVGPFGEAVRYVRQANAGLAAARNAGARLARGEWLIFLDSDDRLRPGALAAHAAAARRHPEAAVLCGGRWDVDANGRPLAERPPPSFEPDPYHALLAFNAAPPLCYLVRCDAAEAVGFFEGVGGELFGHEDWDFWLRLAAAGYGFASVAAAVGDYRVAAGSMSSHAARMYDGARAVLARSAARHPRCAACPALLARGRHLQRLIYSDRVVNGQLRQTRSPRQAAGLLAEAGRRVAGDPKLALSLTRRLAGLVGRAVIPAARGD